MRVCQGAENDRGSDREQAVIADVADAGGIGVREPQFPPVGDLVGHGLAIPLDADRDVIRIDDRDRRLPGTGRRGRAEHL